MVDIYPTGACSVKRNGLVFFCDEYKSLAWVKKMPEATILVVLLLPVRKWKSFAVSQKEKVQL
jgi:hypothetical protein